MFDSQSLVYIQVAFYKKKNMQRPGERFKLFEN
jgi:hypothetical protein